MLAFFLEIALVIPLPSCRKQCYGVFSSVWNCTNTTISVKSFKFLCFIHPWNAFNWWIATPGVHCTCWFQNSSYLVNSFLWRSANGTGIITCATQTVIDYFGRCGAFVHCYTVSITQWYASNLLHKDNSNFVAMVQAIFPSYFVCTVYVSMSSSHLTLYYLLTEVCEQTF